MSGLDIGFTESALAQQTPLTSTVTVRGVRVVADAYGEGVDALRPFGLGMKGTGMALLLTVPNGGLIAVNEGEPRLTKMTDDRGTDLTGGRSKMGLSVMHTMPEISSDGKACMVEINGSEVPVKDAVAVFASGTITFSRGTNKEAATHEKVPLNLGTKITVGKMVFEIVKIGKPEEFGPGDEEAFEVTLRTNRDWTNIADIVFLDAAGKNVNAKPGSSSFMSMGKMKTVEKSFVLPKRMDVATVVVTYWTDLQDITVPFEVKATLGLQ
jgi:hypothetical protein